MAGARELGLGGLVALAAEVELDRELPRIVRVPVDFAALAAAGPPALAIRIGDGRHRPLPIAEIADLAAELIAAADAAGVAVAELHVDHDCPTRRLDECAALLASLRQRIAPIPLVFTALPTWLDERQAFARLLATADGFVLQVHSLEIPAIDRPARLCDPELAQRAVELAATFGRPFRVALPTHSYVVAFDAAGRLSGVVAENGPASLIAGDDRQRLVGSDPAEMAALVRGWIASRPPEMAGILWYRLPVAGDRRNWTPESLRAVVGGRAPQRRLEVAVRRPEPGLVEVDLVNAGDTAEPPPSRIHLAWSGGAPVAGDGLAGYRFDSALRTLVLTPLAGADPQRPGERRPVAWLRWTDPSVTIGGFLEP